MKLTKPLVTALLLLLLLALLWSPKATAQDYEIYVSDAGNFSQPPWQILKFDQNGENPEVFITENLDWPHDIVFLEDSNSVLVSNFNSGRIDRYNASTGRFIDIFASGLGGPTRMKIGPDNRLYAIQASGTQRVKRYELDGTPLDDFTFFGLPRGLGMDWDTQGNLYVSSYDWRIVRAFDPQGSDLGSFINSYLAGPTNIWFRTNGDLLISDYNNNTVWRFDQWGRHQGPFIQGLSQPEGVAVLPNGNMLLGDGGTSAVKMYTSDGEYIEDLITSGSGGLIRPNAIVIRQRDGHLKINAGLNDAWYNPLTDGQGFLVTVYPDQQRMFVAWYTYDTERPADDVTADLGEPGHRWLTAQGPYEEDSAELTIYVTEGGVFDSAQPPATTDPDGDGTLTLEFADCTEGLVTYRITSLGISGEVPIERVALDNVALCEELAGQ